MNTILQKLNDTIDKHFTGKYSFGKQAQQVAQQDLPYCYRQIPNGKYLMLNRQYKPLGYPLSDHCNYEDHYHTALTAEELGIDETAVENDTHYLYQDGIDPPFNSRKLLESYLKKLEPMLKQTA